MIVDSRMIAPNLNVAMSELTQIRQQIDSAGSQ